MSKLKTWFKETFGTYYIVTYSFKFGNSVNVILIPPFTKDRIAFAKNNITFNNDKGCGLIISLTKISKFESKSDITVVNE